MITEKDLLEHRQKNFAVEFGPSTSPSFNGEMCLLITHNGFQWSAIGLLPEEVEKMIAAIRKVIP